MQKYSKAMLLLVCSDHLAYFDSFNECFLKRLPFPVVILANRSSGIHFENMGPQVEVRYTSWGDMDMVRRDARALAAEREIFAIGTGAERLLDLAAELREQLGVAGMLPAEVERYRNKVLMKEIVGGAGLRVPEYCLADEREAVAALLAKHGKIVLKPIDGAGSRSVSFVSSGEQLEAWYARNSGQDFEADEFIEGPLYHLNAVVHEGRVLMTAIAQYVPGKANIDFSKGEPFVSVLVDEGPLKEKLRAYSDDVITHLGLRDGITHLECFVTPEEEVVLCEIAARPGGGGIVNMIEMHHGINYNYTNLLLQAGYGSAIEIPRPTPSQSMGLIGFRLAVNCRLTAMATADDFQDDWIKFSRFYSKPGDFKAAAKHCTDFVCLLVFDCRSEAHFSERCEHVQQRFNDLLCMN